jgi:hypothetical protein
MKRILVILAALALLASPALGAGGATTFQYGEIRSELLVRSQLTEIDTAGHCMSFYQDVTADVTSEACDDDDINEIVWPQNAWVEELKVVILVNGDASTSCKFTLEVGGVAKVANTTSVDQTLSTVEAFAINYNLADGDLVGIMVTDGVTCGGGTAEPNFIVELWGTWLADDAF